MLFCTEMQKIGHDRIRKLSQDHVKMSAKAVVEVLVLKKVS